MKRLGRIGAVVAMAGVAACGGGPSGSEQVHNFRYDPVSPCGEVLGAPTASEIQYKTDMLVWFHRIDTNHDGVLTLDEVLADTDQCFDRMDADHDGSITPLELQQYRLHQPFHAPAVKPTLRLGDNMRVTNPDAVETPGEDSDSWFGGGTRQIYYGLDPVMSADADADFRVTRDELRAQTARKFARWDVHHDGRVTVEGFLDSLLAPVRAINP